MSVIKDGLVNSLQSVLKVKSIYVAMTSLTLNSHQSYGDLPKATDEESDSDDDMFASSVFNTLPHSVEPTGYAQIHDTGVEYPITGDR